MRDGDDDDGWILTAVSLFAERYSVQRSVDQGAGGAAGAVVGLYKLNAV